ncbi:IclR family transcriptional regulator [Halosimplex aquaticum]
MSTGVASTYHEQRRSLGESHRNEFPDHRGPGARGGAGVSELARAVDLSKSAVYKHVQTLERLGYLVRDGDDYYLSNRFRSLASRASERFPVEVLREVVEDLAETTGHVANFIAHEGRNGIYVVCVDDYSDSKSATTEGDTAPFHATAGGKAILAFLSESERDRILQRVGTPAYTDKTITDREELERELQTVRDQRIAFDREEYVAGHQCVASRSSARTENRSARSASQAISHRCPGSASQRTSPGS